jgi:antirestriction protein ArdC
MKVYDYVLENIVKGIESQGVLPWHKPWNSNLGRPQNLCTKRPYRGVNIFLLGAFTPYESPYWVTYKQAEDLGGKVRKGEKGHMVTYWKISKYNKVGNAFVWLPPNAEQFDGKSFLLRYYTVFNTEQVDGIESKIPVATIKPFNPIEACEAVWNGFQDRPTIINGHGSAFYRPSTDQIGMPAKSDFHSETDYYSTLFHEAIHSTGAEKRCNREFGEAFGTEQYSKEEMIAEMGASFLNAECGILEAQQAQSQAYISNWLDKIKENPKWLISAASKAEAAVEYILAKNAKEEEETTEEAAMV